MVQRLLILKTKPRKNLKASSKINLKTIINSHWSDVGKNKVHDTGQIWLLHSTLLKKNDSIIVDWVNKTKKPNPANTASMARFTQNFKEPTETGACFC